MQNNVTELTQRLLRSLDSNYNVINMPEVVDIISLLEKVAITKELLETTRLGKHVNELRRKTTNPDLSRRAKELLKKWRSMVLPEANGQIKTSPPLQPGATKVSPPLGPPLQAQTSEPRASPVPPTKVSPPMLAQPRVSPALQSHRTVSPSLQGYKVSPSLTIQKLISPNKKLVSPGLSTQKVVGQLVSPAQKLVSPSLQCQKLVSPGHPAPQRMLSPGLPVQRMVSPNLPALKASSQKIVSPSVHGQRVSLSMGGPNLALSPPLMAGENADVNLNQVKSKKRPAKEALDTVNAKRSRFNGNMTDFEFSDSSNSSFKDVILPSAIKPELKADIIVINSDSNSSFPEKIAEPLVDQQLPKKRGRKKGSKNHKHLLDEAETSFTNKLAVSASRGNSKVKTTQELLASIQSKNSVLSTVTKSKEDLEEKAAKLTERVSIIDQKLNTNRNKNSQRNKYNLSSATRNEKVIESGSVINDKSLLNKLKEEEDEDISVVDEVEGESDVKTESQETDTDSTVLKDDANVVRSLSVEEALALLPPIDKSVLLEDDTSEPACTCYLKENKPDFSIDEEDVEQRPPFEIIEDPHCPARRCLEEKYHAHDVSDEKVQRLHNSSIPNVNGNFSTGFPKPEPEMVDGLYINVVPNIYERLDRDETSSKSFDSEAFKRYSVSESADDGSVVVAEQEQNSDIVIKKEIDSAEDKDFVKKEMDGGVSDVRTEEKEVFREWYECVDRPSYDGETLRILPYCIVD